MTAAHRDELRRRIDLAVRRRLRSQCENGWRNPETGYRRGCHCDACRLGTAEARRARKLRRRERGAA